MNREQHDPPAHCAASTATAASRRDEGGPAARQRHLPVFGAAALVGLAFAWQLPGPWAMAAKAKKRSIPSEIWCG